MSYASSGGKFHRERVAWSGGKRAASRLRGSMWAFLFLRGLDGVDARLQGPDFAVPLEGSSERAGKSDSCLQAVAGAGVLHVDGALRMRIGSREGGQRTHMWSDAHGCESGACRFDAGNDGEQIVDGCAVHACESERVSPGTSGQVLKWSASRSRHGLMEFRYSSAKAGMLKGAGEVKAEVVGGAQDAIGCGAGLNSHGLAEYFLLVVLGNDVIEHAEDAGLLTEPFLIGGIGDHAARGVPAFGGEAGAHMGEPVS